jgi:hypothetical protein
MKLLNRSAIVVRPRRPFWDWVHDSDSTSRQLTLLDLVQEPTIYLIPECDISDEVDEVLHELCEEIFDEQLSGWYTDTSRWPRDRSMAIFSQWFDYRHYSMLVDLSDEPLRCD